jgi:hypothetical protein
VPPDDEQEVCSKHVEAINRNKLKVNSASCLCYTDVLTCPVNKTLSSAVSSEIKIKLARRSFAAARVQGLWQAMEKDAKDLPL